MLGPKWHTNLLSCSCLQILRYVGVMFLWCISVVQNQTKLQRHPTPYAKDLKAKARKIRNIDGRRSPEGSKRSSTGSLVPSESAPTPPITRPNETDEADQDKPAVSVIPVLYLKVLPCCCENSILFPVYLIVTVYGGRW